MNPIEKAFSKLKAFLRKIANEPSRPADRPHACADIFQPHNAQITSRPAI